MFDLDHRNKTVRFIIGLAACWFVTSEISAAESDSDSARPRVLVVVTDPFDAECVRRIGREYVQVESLFALDSDVHPSKYHVCNKRVLGLLTFRLFVFRSDCSSAAFWCERMGNANPEGKVHRLARPRCFGAGDCDRGMQQATDIHRALVLILPEHRALLNANLEVELDRLRLRQFASQQIVSAETLKSHSIAMAEGG
ncbi:MAG: hypothetical protein P8L85_11445 [Rubripirellula sp.]|nr:hypothetical protein [Rubripirellula sp.]